MANAKGSRPVLRYLKIVFVEDDRESCSLDRTQNFGKAQLAAKTDRKKTSSNGIDKAT